MHFIFGNMAATTQTGSYQGNYISKWYICYISKWYICYISKAIFINLKKVSLKMCESDDEVYADNLSNVTMKYQATVMKN